MCPLGIDIKEIMYHGRTLLKKTDKRRRHLRLLIDLFTKQPRLCFKLLGMTSPLLFPYLSKRGLLPFQPDLPEKSLKERFQVVTATKKRGRVAVFSGCAVNFLSPHLGESLVNVLNALGFEVIFPPGEVCCGVPLRSLGLENEAVKLSQKNLDIFGKLNVEAILSLCPTCTLALRDDYPKLLGKGLDNVMDISSFLVNKVGVSSVPKLPSPVHRALFHDPCHLKYGLGIMNEPREIIENLGIDLVEKMGERCCGFAGVFCFSYRKFSQGLLQKCVQDYSKSRAEMIITSCPGCIMQLTKEMRDKPIFHIIEVIEESVLQPMER
jgi:glycolate oxidase iron-sulfur subunit